MKCGLREGGSRRIAGLKHSSTSFAWAESRFAETSYQERGANLLAKATDLGEV